MRNASRTANGGRLAAKTSPVEILSFAKNKLNKFYNPSNALQTNSEEKACQHAQKTSEVLNPYYNDFANAESAYHCAVQEIMELERDRKREWITLQVVNCLLERIRLQNGVPRDDANGGVTEEVGICEERRSIQVCTNEEGEPRLCLEYPAVPPHPQTCPVRDQVIGVCLPVV